MTTSSSLKLDPVQFEVIRNALVEAAEEMGLTLRRSAYSTNIKTRADFSCVIFDRDLRFLASNFAQATHLGSMYRMVPMVVRKYGQDRIGPDDAIIANNPYLGGVHLNDIALIAPVYHEETLFGYVANIAHHVDVGGGAPGSIGAFREIYQEGIIISPVKIVSGGELVPDVMSLVLDQIRSKHETAGDFRAQIAALKTGIRRIGELLDRYGDETIVFYANELIEYTERRTRRGISQLPQGTFTGEGQVDNDGFTTDPVHLAVKVVISEEEIFFDFDGSDMQRHAPVNSTLSMTLSACAYVLKCLIDPDIPANEGFYRVLRIHAPLGSVLNCKHPAAVVGGFETHIRLVETIFHALVPAMPEDIPAGTKGMLCHAGFGGPDPESGEYFCFLETLAGGYGARYGSDGPDAVQVHGQNTQNAPIEETELNYPVRISRYELVEDSEGAGRWRGGLGVRRDYVFPERSVSFTILADRDREGPHGLFGGLPAACAEYVLNPDGEGRRLGSKVTVQLEPGDVVSYRTCGGGGYGEPAEREAQLVLDDVRDGKIELGRARDVYGVAIASSDWTIDEQETERLRSARQA